MTSFSDKWHLSMFHVIFGCPMQHLWTIFLQKHLSSQSICLWRAWPMSRVTHNLFNIPGAQTLWVMTDLCSLNMPALDLLLSWRDFWSPRTLVFCLFFPKSSLLFTQPLIKLVMLIDIIDFLCYLEVRLWKTLKLCKNSLKHPGQQAGLKGGGWSVIYSLPCLENSLQNYYWPHRIVVRILKRWNMQNGRATWEDSLAIS